MTTADATSLLADPSWLAHRYDRQQDEVHFAWLPREQRRAISFLTQPEVAQAPRQVVSRGQLAKAAFRRAPLHMILHSGLTGSTLLTRALDREGIATTLSEPPLLTDIVSYTLSGVAADEALAVADLLLGLLSRAFEPGEAVIVKAGAVGNLLGNAVLQRDPESRGLCLHAPLPVFLASNARKGLWGRLWGRRLFATLSTAGANNIGFTPAELFEQSDLQIAALGWLVIHRVMGSTAARYPLQVGSSDSETLLARPHRAVAAVAAHFGLQVDADNIACDPLFQRHSKTGGEFDSHRRAEELREARTAHGEEIDMVVEWAAKVAEAQGIALELPGRLAF